MLNAPLMNVYYLSCFRNTKSAIFYNFHLDDIVLDIFKWNDISAKKARPSKTQILQGTRFVREIRIPMIFYFVC